MTYAGTAMVDETAVEKLKASLRGELVRPNDRAYDAARQVFNAMIDRRPALIVHCTGVADILRTMEFGRTYDVPVAVRGGGHSVAGKAVCDGGIVIDLSSMKGLRVDPARRTARAEPGLRLAEFDRETQAFRLATTLGVISNTGIAGLTLGGGLGWLNGILGLACDNVLSVDLLIADGRLVTANADENEDLFWGVRGGSGNFGIVTSFEYRLHPVGPVLGGMVLYARPEARQVLRAYHDFASGCPDELSTVAALVTAPDGRPAVAVLACYAGPLTEGEEVVKPLRALGSPIADLIRPMPYVEMQRLLDEHWLQRRLHYWKSGFVRSIGTDLIEAVVEHTASQPSPATNIVFQQMHGAASRVGPAETAFAHRHQQYDFAIYSMWLDPLETEKNVKWTREFWEALHPFVEQGVYVNNLGEEGDERVRAAYGPNYDRLVTLKNKYDPTNFFRLNHNVKPTA